MRWPVRWVAFLLNLQLPLTTNATFIGQLSTASSAGTHKCSRVARNLFTIQFDEPADAPGISFEPLPSDCHKGPRAYPSRSAAISGFSAPSLRLRLQMGRERRVGTKRYSVNSGSDDGKDLFDPDRALGVLVLLTVPLAWGTYAPVVRYIYEIDPPIPGFVFSAGYYLVASATLAVLVGTQMNGATNNDKLSLGNEFSGSDLGPHETTSFPIAGGIELGSYLFLGNCLQVVGLKSVPADRAAFLVQLTTVMVPLVQAALAGNILAIPLHTWVACLMAFAGVFVMGLDGQDTGLDMGHQAIVSSISSGIDAFTSGDFLIVMAAFAYTMHVVRLGQYAQSTTPLELAACKALTEAVFSVTLVLGLLMFSEGEIGGTSKIVSYLRDSGTEISAFFSSVFAGISSGSLTSDVLLPAIGAILWTGWITCAYTIYAQSFGQRRVSPTDANLIYTAQPVFSAFFAWILLDETLGKVGWAGGTLIAAALLLVSSSELGDHEKINQKSSQKWK